MHRQAAGRIIFTLGAVAALMLSAAAGAQDYPTRPIMLTVAYSPGGATDLQARIVSQPAARRDHFGRPMVIVNKPGAGGKVAWTWFASRAQKTGYEVAVYNLPHVLAQSIALDADYGLDTLEPIANFGADPAVLVVSRDSPIDSVADFIAHAKQNPASITVSGAGLYVGHHIALLQLERAADIDLTYVPFPGAVPALTSLIGGQVQAGFNNLSDAYRSRDRLKILAVADLERDAEFLPDVPTFLEQGIEIDDASVNFRGFMVPTGTPMEVTDVLAERLPAMFADEDVVTRMREGGASMRIMSRDEVQALWQRHQAALETLLTDLEE
ncbi:MAG: tripartite tricarboxylate transporter substrate binding protein [Gammaproteobacteria bacterium]|nr:tripartite tricarboxylate transporter substrate binding protein [Gammaproteobacteria bacterium]